MKKLAPEDPGFDAEVERVHAAYKAEIVATYERYRQQFGYGQRELLFLEDAKKK